MMGWDFTFNKVEDDLKREVIMQMDAEPVFAELSEKVRDLAAELHLKIINQELQWSLMLTPVSMLEDLKGMCEREIERRKKEFEDFKEKEEETQEDS
jgi:hypothetical protein